MSQPAARPFTGRHMTAIMLGFFAVVIVVNLVMASMASATFGGVVVRNSYVASQRFNRWLAEAAADRALGWTVHAARMGDGRLAVTVAGVPQGATLAAVARHPLGRAPDRALAFAPAGAGRFVSGQPLPAGRWRLRYEVRSGATVWRSEGEAP